LINSILRVTGKITRFDNVNFPVTNDKPHKNSTLLPGIKKRPLNQPESFEFC
jgi:hypothetical protein